ncbi:hypothetical protein L915_20788 [Phytophthora nicotianae]|uniref:Uncharacterized protein n=2 Tax=Phytophthora nicotianae TaxID=4792 RepID=V9DXV8_PHYNI|nr:hypothetical protein F443_21389 [Phytophthora nicotianae P1569]ETK72049.1 hypothetical protein L915_20788 [Phytophthora nicotianae]
MRQEVSKTMECRDDARALAEDTFQNNQMQLQCCHAWLYNSHLRQNKLAHARLHRTRKARFRQPAVMMSPLWWSSHAWDSHPNDRPAVGRRSSTAQGSTAPLPG